MAVLVEGGRCQDSARRAGGGGKYNHDEAVTNLYIDGGEYKTPQRKESQERSARVQIEGPRLYPTCSSRGK
ncbi:hypothetical protein U9M48_018147 [Paspalum notatum var. saurae]|uniref:Uncharacterized protein n=1 Tax=Paspalum notatum var. saurae TaxID=547442 RepID=A0AAQ3TAX0_PASNO